MPYKKKDDIVSWVDAICTCNICSNHDTSRKCIEFGCKCCTVENHTMIMDGMEGFVKPSNGNEKPN
jgi:hypothetical protein